jgi:hypothetical protein
MKPGRYFNGRGGETLERRKKGYKYLSSPSWPLCGSCGLAGSTDMGGRVTQLPPEPCPGRPDTQAG